MTEYESKYGRRFSTEHEAKQDTGSFEDHALDGVGEGVGKAVGAVGVGILAAIPYVIGSAIGGFIALLLKIGIVGRVLLTSSAFGTGWFIVSAIMVFVAAGFGIESGTLVVKILIFLGIIPGFFLAVWFWRSHYQALLKISGTDIVVMAIKFCKTIFSWLLVVAFIHLVVFIISLGAIQKFRILNYFVWFYSFPFLLALYNWFKAIYGWGLFNNHQTVEKEPLIEFIFDEAKPSECPPAGNRFAKGDYVWAFNKREYCFAMIDDAQEDKLKLTFYDGEKAEVNREEVFYFDEMQYPDFKPYYFQRKTIDWECVVKKKMLKEVMVITTDHEIKEKIPYQNLKFKNTKRMAEIPQAGYVGAEPTACPAAENRFAKGDCVWADRRLEYFYAVIDDATGKKIDVTFYDGQKAQVSRDDICYFTELRSKKLTYAYREKKKKWQECVIDNVRTHNVLIRYKTDWTTAAVPYEYLKFI